MTSKQSNSVAKIVCQSVLLIAVFCALPSRSRTQVQSNSESAKSSPTAQQGFDSPEQAANSLIAAADQFDVPSLMKIFGPAGADFVASANPVEDKKIAIAFAAKAHEKNSVEVDPKNPNRAVLIVGAEEWPFPIPIVKKNGMWRFDTNAGSQEILLRRIGANELDAITICRGYVEAQLEYASQIHDDSGVNEYAQKDHQYSGETRRAGLAERRRKLEWSGRRSGRESLGGRIRREAAVPRLLLQAVGRAGTGCTAGKAELFRRRRNDWRLCHRCLARRLPRHRRADFHRQL